MRTIRLNTMVFALLLITFGSLAQTKKLNKTYKTSSNVTVDLDSRHTNVIIENWDRNEVQVEAYLEGEFKDKETLNKMLESWDVTTSTIDGVVKITSGGKAWNMDMQEALSGMNFNMTELQGSLAELPEILGPVMNDLVGPILLNIAENPLPPGFAEDMQGVQFDYEAYKKDGDKYLKEYEKKFEKKFGKEYEVKMEKWAKEVEKNAEKWEKENEAKMEEWGKKFEKDMEVWGAKFEKDMEKWGEEFGKQMEAWGENFGKQFEAQMKGGSKVYILDGDNSKAKRTLKIKIPKDAKLLLNVRHGELKLASVTKNLKADLSHSRLSANRIMGRDTNVKVAYSPVNIAYWDYGVLSTQFVKSCTIDKAVSIKLESNSSDVKINELQKTGVLSGSFGKLDINNLGNGFETLNISLENSDLELNVPETAFNFSFNGNQSKIKHPQTLKLKSTKSYDNEILRGYYKSSDGNGNIVIKANFSDVLIN